MHFEATMYHLIGLIVHNQYFVLDTS